MKQIKKAIVTAALALMPFVASAQTQDKPQEEQPKLEVIAEQVAPAPEERRAPKLDLSGSATIGLTNEYLAVIGYPLFGGTATQGLINLNVAKDLYMKGDSVSCAVWFNYGHGGKSNNAPHELDLEVDYNFPSFKALNGDMTVSAGYADWRYPGKLLSSMPDHMFILYANYAGKINASAKVIQRINDGVAKDRLFQLSASKSFSPAKKVTLTPGVSATVADQFFGQKGYLGTATSFTVGYSLDRVILEGYVKRFWANGNHSLMGMTQKDESQYGVNITLPWNGKK